MISYADTQGMSQQERSQYTNVGADLSPLSRNKTATRRFDKYSEEAHDLIGTLPTGEDQRNRLKGIGQTLRTNNDLAADQEVQNISHRFGGIKDPTAILLATNARLGAEGRGGSAYAQLLAEALQSGDQAKVDAMMQLLQLQLSSQQINDAFSVNNANIGIQDANAAEARRVSQQTNQPSTSFTVTK